MVKTACHISNEALKKAVCMGMTGLVSFLPVAHQCLVACKLPYAEREAALAVRALVPHFHTAGLHSEGRLTI